MSKQEDTGAIGGEGVGFSSGLSSTQLEAALQTLQNGVPVTEQVAITVFRYNAIDGGVFRKAAEEGRVNVVKFLLNAKDQFKMTAQEKKRCTNEGAADREGATPLHLAASCGHAAIVDAIISSGASVNAKDNHGNTPLHGVCRQKNSIHMVKKLLELGASINIMNASNQTPVMVCRDDVLQQMLIRCGADVHMTDSDGCVLLHRAESTQTAQLLLENNALFDARDKYGHTAMHLQCCKGNTAVVQLLIDHGSSINTKNKGGESPLVCAVKAKRPDVVRLLLDNEADDNVVCTDGYTLLHYATGCSEILCILLESGANVNVKNLHFQTPLHLAVMFSYLDVAHILIEHGANTNVADRWGKTPLHYAVKEEMIEYLLRHGADINAVDNRGCTAAHWAAFTRNRSMFDYFVEHGADMTLQNEFGYTPLEIISAVL